MALASGGTADSGRALADCGNSPRRQMDRETRRQGDKETRRQGHGITTAGLLVSLSPRLLVFLRAGRSGAYLSATAQSGAAGEARGRTPADRRCPKRLFSSAARRI